MSLQKRFLKNTALPLIGFLIGTIEGGYGMYNTSIEEEGVSSSISYDPGRKMIYMGKSLDQVSQFQMAPTPVRRNENLIEYPLTTSETDCALSPVSPSIKTQSFPIAYISQILQETILGASDRRTLVDEPGIEPWCVHGHMEMDYGNSIYIGTGTLIGENYVITAAHNLYDRKSNSIPHRITFYPGLKQRKILAASQADRIIYHPSYMDSSNTNFQDADIGIIRLKEPLGKKVGYFGMKILSNSQLSEISEGRRASITGYPGDYAGGTLMCTMEGPIKEWTPSRLFYDIDTAPGQSGSGVWIDDEGEYGVVAIHTYGNEGKKLNSGTRINDENGKLVKIWTSSSN